MHLSKGALASGGPPYLQPCPQAGHPWPGSLPRWPRPLLLLPASTPGRLARALGKGAESPALKLFLCFLAAKRPVSPYSGYNGQLLTSVYQPTEMALMHKGPVRGVLRPP